MIYDFDSIIDRKNTNSLKYDFSIERGKPADILPLWVADMDFQAPKEVLDALHQAVDHGIFGYSEVKEDYFLAVHHWFLKFFGWEVKEAWMIKTPGVVYAISQAIRAFTKVGESVMIQQPVYYPFGEAIRANNRNLVINSLVYEHNRYYIDFEDFEQKIIDNQVRLFILCSPHNPVGRVWTREELLRLGSICLRHGVLIVSDEIHCDFTYPDHPHTVLASLSDALLEQTVTCTAPSKTFNLAGLQISNVFIKNEALRTQFKHEILRSGYSQMNSLGLVACQSAYKYGAPWLAQLKTYLLDNLNFVKAFLKERLPMIQLVEPEGTYLIWLDFKALNLGRKEMSDLIVNKAKLWLDPGQMFGPEGEGFQRINIACPRDTLQKALLQLESAIKGL